jgi:hypothetical protein
MQKATVFFEILSGIFIFRRMLSEIRLHFLLEKVQIRALSILFFIFNSLLVFLPARSLSLFTLIWAFGTISFALTPHFVRILRQNEMKRQIPFMVSSLILGVRMGLALRPALLRTATHIGGYSGQKLRKLHDHLVLRAPLHQVDPILQELQSTLLSCESESHLTAQRLLGYRHKLEIEEKFTRKSRQVLHQLRGQSYVLAILFLVTFSFVVNQFGFQENAKLLVSSVVVFAFGVFLTLRQGRKIKWTV